MVICVHLSLGVHQREHIRAAYLLDEPNEVTNGLLTEQILRAQNGGSPVNLLHPLLQFEKDHPGVAFRDLSQIESNYVVDGFLRGLPGAAKPDGGRTDENHRRQKQCGVNMQPSFPIGIVMFCDLF